MIKRAHVHLWAVAALIIALASSLAYWQSQPADAFGIAAGGVRTEYSHAKSPQDAWELYELLEAAGIPHPEVFTQVAITESGWQLNSPVARENHNYFGFIYPNERWSYSIGEHLGHARYASAQAGIQDLKLWLALNPPRPGEDPYAFLARRGYNPNPGYYAYVASINLCRGMAGFCNIGSKQLVNAGG